MIIGDWAKEDGVQRTEDGRRGNGDWLLVAGQQLNGHQTADYKLYYAK
jgi:hypothetical protein